MAKAFTPCRSESNLQALKKRASVLLASDEAGERTNFLKQVWPDGQPPVITSSAKDEAIWQQCLLAFGRCSSSALLSAKHFLKVTEADCDANRVPFPHKILREGYRKPILWDNSVNAYAFEDLEFILPGAIATVDDARWSSGSEKEFGQAWLESLAKIPDELRAPMHADVITFDMTLVPWPVLPLKLLATDGSDQVEVAEDSQLFQEGRYLRSHIHQYAQELDFSLEPWHSVPEAVIADDVCTDAQLKLLEARMKRGPLSERALARRRANINPQFFEEVHPTMEKHAAFAEMQARWVKDKATAAREYAEAAEYGSQFVAWPIPNERRWPELPRAWVQHARWFQMWRRSQHALQATAQKLHASRSSRAESEASWEALSECSDSSWQAVSEVSDASWLELGAESGAPAEFDNSVHPEELGAFDSLSEEDLAKLKLEVEAVKEDCAKDLAAAMPALELAVAALSVLSKGDIGEIRALKTPPHGVVLAAQALCLMFEVKPVKVRATSCHSKMQTPQRPKFDYWEAAKKQLLANPNLLGRMINYDKDNISDSVMTKIKPLISNPEFQPDQVKKASVAAQGICLWIHALVTYHHVANEVQPKKLRLVAAEKALAKAEAVLAMKQAKHGQAFEETVHEDTNNMAGADVGLADAATAVDVALQAALETAAVALECLDKKDITEIKSMSQPPQPVMIVCMCVCILRPLGKEDESAGWAGAKKMLSDSRLRHSLLVYNKDGVSEGQIKKIRNLLAREEQLFAGDLMKCVSKAAYGLLQWVLAIVRHFEVAHAMEERKLLREQARAKEDLAENDAPIIKARAELSKVEEKGGQLESNQNKQRLSPCISKFDIAELKCLGSPPDMVMKTATALSILLGRGSSWTEAKALLCDVKLDSLCMNFDEACVTPAIIEELEPYVNSPTFTPECVGKVSKAAVGMCKFVRDKYEHARANMDDASTVSPPSPQSVDLPRDFDFLDITQFSSPAGDTEPSQVQCT